MMHLFIAVAALLLATPAVVLHEPVKEIQATKGHGKPFGMYKSPGKRATLIYSSDSTGGDFPESSIYVVTTGHLYDLGTYRSLNKVTWAKDGKSVSFEAAKLKEYGTDDVCLVTYRLGSKTLDRKILRQQKDEPSG